MLIALAGCQPAGREPDALASIDWPSLDEVERPVAQKIESAQRAVAARRDSPQAWGDLGMALQAHTFYSAAVSAYEEASRLSPADYRWPYLAGESQRKLELGPALRFFETAQRLRPENPGFYINFGNLLVERGLTDRAGELYGEALRQHGESGHALYGLAQIDLINGNLETARDRLTQAVRINPSHGEAHSLLAQVFHRMDRPELARIESIAARAYPESSAAPDPVLEAVDAQAASSQALSRRGLSLARRGEYRQAEELFRRVLEVRPGSARDLANLGAALAGQNRLDEAVELYRQALALDDGDAHANNNLALALIEKGQFDLALEHARVSTRIDSNFAEAHQTEALALQRQGRSDQALASYEKALEANPALPGARNNMARIFAGKGRLKDAIEQWQLAVSIDPRDMESMYNLGAAFATDKQHGRSIATFEAAVKLAPNSSILLRSLAWELSTAPESGLRDSRRALELASRVYASYPNDPGVADTYAAALAEGGRFQEAAAVIEKAMSGATSTQQGRLGRGLAVRLQLYRRGQAYRQPQ